MKTTLIFKKGNSQAVLIPQEMNFSNKKVLLHKIGSVMIVIDTCDSWASLKLAQALISPGFMNVPKDPNLEDS